LFPFLKLRYDFPRRRNKWNSGPNMEKNEMNPFFEFQAAAWEDLGGGVRRKMVKYTDELMAVYVQFDKGAVGPVHSHEIHDQISCVAAGSFEIQIDNEKRVLKVGDAYLATRHTPHGAVALERDSMLIDVFAPKRADFLPVD